MGIGRGKGMGSILAAASLLGTASLGSRYYETYKSRKPKTASARVPTGTKRAKGRRGPGNQGGRKGRRA